LGVGLKTQKEGTMAAEGLFVAAVVVFGVQFVTILLIGWRVTKIYNVLKDIRDDARKRVGNP
jgi:hypothetical protein